jgi:hypothetical protein
MFTTGLYPTSKEAARVLTDKSGNQTIQKGPFDGPSLGGYSVITAADLNEATELVKTFPYKMPGSGVEVRRIVEFKDLPIPDEGKAKAKELRWVLWIDIYRINRWSAGRELMAKNAAALRS